MSVALVAVQLELGADDVAGPDALRDRIAAAVDAAVAGAGAAAHRLVVVPEAIGLAALVAHAPPRARAATTLAQLIGKSALGRPLSVLRGALDARTLEPRHAALVASGATRVCSAVFHCTLKISKPRPATNAASAIAATGAGGKSSSGTSALGRHASVAASIGREKWTRIATAPPVTRPRPCAPAIQPQLAAPPRDCFATIGPTTAHAPNQPISMTLNWSTIAQSHVCAVNSRQPSRRSRSRLARAARGCSAAPRMLATSSALAANVAASTPSATPAPANAAMRPPAAAPSPNAVAWAIESQAFAVWSRSRGTTSGTRPTDAGKWSANATPETACSATTTARLAPPASRSAAIAPCVHAARRSAPTICRRREPRSASAPAKSCIATCAPEPTAITRPTSLGVPLRSSSTAKGSAIGAIALPNAETRRAAKSRAKAGSRSSRTPSRQLGVATARVSPKSPSRGQPVRPRAIRWGEDLAVHRPRPTQT